METINGVFVVKKFGDLKVEPNSKDVTIYFSPMASSGIVSIDKSPEDDFHVVLVARNCKIDGCDIKTIVKPIKLKTNGKDWKTVV